jgi:proline racemase
MSRITDGWNWQPPPGWTAFRTVDLHTGGEPLRVFLDGLPEIKGRTILEKRRYFRDNFDHIRTGTMFEPRGHADMYGAIITEPVTGDGDFGTFFLHNEGYSTMCGHAIIALVTLVLDSGMLKKDGLEPLVKIDAPPGRVTAVGHRDGKTGRVERVSFRNVPSFLALRDQVAEVPGIGKVTFDLAYGGAFYAYVDARPLGLPLDAANYNRIIEYGKSIKRAVMSQFPVRHPFEDDLSFLYGTIFIGDSEDPAHHSRNVCIFAEGEVDRSATGTGVSGRAAIHYAKGEIEAGETITVESILGTCMTVSVVDTTTFGPHDAVIPEVSGRAWITGENRFYFDPSDPLGKGFIFR